MADAVKDLLARFTLDISGWNASTQQASKILDNFASADKARGNASKSQTADAISGLKTQLTIVQTLISATGRLAAVEQQKANAIKEQGSAANEVSRQQTQVINTQIAAERLKEASAKAALAEQRRATQEAIASAQEVANTQKRLAKEASEAAKQAFREAQNPRQDYSKIPINRPDNREAQLPERFVESTSKQRQAAQEISATSVAGNAELEESNNAVATSYERIAAAQTEVARTAANVRETQSAIAAGQLEGPAAQTRLASDLQAQAVARKELSDAQAVSEEKILALKNQQRVVTAQLEEQEAAIARQKELQALKEDILNRDYQKRNQEAFANQGILKRLFSDYNPNQNYTESQYGSSSGRSGAGIPGVGRGRETRDVFDAFQGRMTVAPLSATASMIPGLNTLTDAVFPVLGLTMFVGLITEGITKLVEMQKQAKEARETFHDTFSAVAIASQTTVDKLQLTNDTLKNTIARLEHKPTNNVAVAIDEIIIKVDELASKSIEAFNNTKKLIEENSPGKWESVKGFFNGFNWGMAPGPDGSDYASKQREVGRSAIQMARDLRDAQNDQQSMQHGANYQALAAKARNSTDRKTQEDAKRQLDALDAPYSARINKTATDAYKEVIKQRGILDNAASAQFKTLSSLDPSTANKKIQDYKNDQQGNVRDVLQYIQTTALNAYKTPQLEDSNNKLQQQQKDIEAAQQAARDSLQQAEAHYSALKELAANYLESRKLDIQKESEANDALYKTGGQSAADYYKKKDQLSHETLQATLEDVNKEREADLAVLAKRRAADPAMTAQMFADEQSKISQQYALKTKQAQGTNQRDVAADALGLREDTISKATQQAQAVLDTRLKAIQQERDASKNSYDEQESGAVEYYTKSLQYIIEERDARLAAIQTQQDAEGDFGKRDIALQRQRVDAYSNTAKQIQDLKQGYPKSLLEDANRTYSSRSGLLQAQGQYMSDPNNGASLSDTQENLRSQGFELTTHITQLQTLEDAADKYSATWYQIRTEIVQAQEALTQLTQRSQNTNSMTSIGGLLGGVAAGGANIFTSRYGRGVMSAIAGGGSTIANSTQLVNGVTTGDWIQRSSTISNADGKVLSGGGIDFNSTIDSFAKKLTSAATAVGQFASSIANANSASAGALGGGLSGAGLGQAAGDAAKNSDSSIGQTLGPYGALFGAVGGAVIGGIFGQKQEEVEDDINKLNVSYKTIMASYSSNNSSLSQTISNLQALIAQAQDEMASSKKGSSQYKNLIQQYNEQITQLEDQQQQKMADLTQQLLILGQASPYQDMLSSIQGILQQYESFAGAAQNATQLAQANQYLTESLQQLGTQYAQQLLQNETQAIQDALDLNNLYNQRNQLQMDYLKSTQQIMGQGTLTRSVTQSQSKFSQLYDLNVQHTQQLEDINEQIAMEQYKVNAESQIFQLATNRQALEMQLLTAQEAGINQDVARIAAMQNLLVQLRSTGYSITNLGSLNTSDPNATQTLLLQLLMSLLNNNSTSAGIASSSGNSLLTQILGNAYSNQGGLGYGAFKGTGLI